MNLTGAMVVGLSSGLSLAGFLLVILAYAGYGAYLLRTGLLRAPVERSARLYLVALLATVAWGGAGLLDLGSSKVFSWHLATALDQLRYGAWIKIGRAHV